MLTLAACPFARGCIAPLISIGRMLINHVLLRDMWNNGDKDSVLNIIVANWHIRFDVNSVSWNSAVKLHMIKDTTAMRMTITMTCSPKLALHPGALEKQNEGIDAPMVIWRKKHIFEIDLG